MRLSPSPLTLHPSPGETPVLAFSPHPLRPSQDRELVRAELYPGETLGAYLERTGIWARIANRAVMVTINGVAVPREWWWRCRPKAGTIINVQALVRGKGSGKNTTAVVLSLALLIASQGSSWQQFAVATWGTSAAAVTAGLLIAGNLAINAMFPPPKPQLSKAQGRFGGESPTYSLAGGANRMRPYEPFPVVMGVHRVFPDLGARPYTEFQGEDQFLFMVFDFGYNDLDLTDYKIGATALADFSGVTLEESGADGALTLFPGNVDTAAGAALTFAASWIERTSSPDATALAVELDGSLFRVDEGGLAAFEVLVEMQYRAVGAPDWLPVEFAPDTVEADVTQYGLARLPQALYGLETVKPISQPTNVTGVNLVYAAPDCPAGNGTLELDIDESSKFLRWTPPGGLAGNWTEVGDHTPDLFLYGGDGAGGNGGKAIRVNVVSWAALPSAGTSDANIAVTGDTPTRVNISSDSRKPLRRTYYFPVARGQYEVRARRLTAETANLKVVSEIVWSQLRTYQPDTADYTGRRRVALKIKASGQLQGSIEQFSAVARAKTEIWDGAAWVAGQQTSNPAWWVLAAARGKLAGGRRVWGAGLPDSRIGLENLKAFGAWCEAKGLTFDAVFDQPVSVQEMLDAIALCGRGTTSNGSGKLEVVWDAPGLPAVGVFGMSNIALDSFEIEYITENLADEVVMSFINADLDWQRDTVRVLAPGVVNPVRPRNLELFGCRFKDQAGAAANLYLAANEHRARRYRWRMDWEAMPLSRGEVGYLSHDLASYDYSGRLTEDSTASVLKLERTVPLNAAGSWVTLVKPDGTFATYAVQGGVEDSSTLNLTAALPFNPGADAAHPPYDYRWLYGHTATPGRKVKIDTITPRGHNVVELSAVDETQAYYDSELNPYLYVAPKPVFGVLQMSNLQVTEEGVRAANGYLVKLIVTWNAQGDYGFADVRAGVNGSPLDLKAASIRNRSVEFTVADGSQVAIEVTGYSSLGRIGQSVRLVGSKTVAFAALFPPSNVTIFGLDGTTFTFEAVPDVDVVGYRIRFHLGDRRTWEDAAPLHEGLVTNSPYAPSAMPFGSVSFGIKAVDAAGQESQAAAWIVTELGDTLVANVIETLDLRATGWPGTITGGTITAGDVLADDKDVLYAGTPAAPFYSGNPGAAFYQSAGYAALAYETNLIVPAAPLAGSRLTIGHELEGDPKKLEYRRIGDAPFYSGNAANPFYTGDPGALFYGMPGEYAPWPGEIVVKRVPYQFKASAAQGGVRGRFVEMQLNIDAPDIAETLDDVVIAAAGTRLPLVKTYSVIKNVQATLEADGGTAVTLTIEDKDAALGPLIKARNSAQAAVQGKGDFHIQGY